MRVGLLTASFVLGIVLVVIGVHRYALVTFDEGKTQVRGLAYQVMEALIVSTEGHLIKARGREILHYELAEPQTAAEQSPFSVTLTLREPEPGDDPNVIYYGSKEGRFASISPERLREIQFELSPPNRNVAITPEGFRQVTVSLDPNKPSAFIGSVSWSVTPYKSGPLTLVLNSNVSSQLGEASDIVLNKAISIKPIRVKTTWEGRWDRLRPSLVYFLGSLLTLPGIIGFFQSRRRAPGRGRRTR